MSDDVVQKAIDEAGEVDMEETSAPPAQETDAEQEESSTSDPKEDAQESESQPEQPETDQAPKEDVPFHEHPRFKEITARNREYKEMIRELEDRQRRMEAALQQPQTPSQNQPQLTPEQVQAKEQLMDLLGLRGVTDNLKTLQEQNRQLTEAQTRKAFYEEEKQLDSFVEKYGLGDSNQVKDTLEEHIDKDPLLSGLKKQPGVWLRAFRDVYFDKVHEVAKRSANKDLIENQNKAKSAKSEARGSASGKTGPKFTGHAVNDLAKLWDQAGGDDGVDMTA